MHCGYYNVEKCGTEREDSEGHAVGGVGRERGHNVVRGKKHEL